MEDITLKKYYELANRELGIQKSYNEDENIYYLIAAIEKLIDRESGTIKINGELRNIETYKIVLNNKIMLQENFEGIDVYSEPKEAVSFIGAIIVGLLSSNLIQEFSFKVLVSLIVSILSVFGFYFGISKLKGYLTPDYINYVSFYKLVLEVLNKQ